MVLVAGHRGLASCSYRLVGIHPWALTVVLAGVLASSRAEAGVAGCDGGAAFTPYVFVTDPHQTKIARMQVEFFEELNRPPAFHVTIGQAFTSRRAAVRQKLLESIGLDPLPERIDLDIHQSEPLEHPWCSVRKIHYQIWPGIYSEAFLYVPKQASQTPRGAILSLTGHWPNGKAYADEQKRCLNFARLGYVVLAPDDNHYEDLPLGISDQTLMVWSNIRALDVLASLPGVDGRRIGACGGSGGGYQVQMLLAVDDRVKAATIMGFTCDYRETLFPHVASHTCLHFPGALAIANLPEVSALGMPVPVQYLIMDDYTRNFRDNAFPAIQDLYRQNGFPEHVDCQYWPTDHVYDAPKRQATYRWMQKWLGEDARMDQEPEEPETTTFPIPRLLALDTGLPDKAREMQGLTALYSSVHKYVAPAIATKDQWLAYRDRKAGDLKRILGSDRLVPVRAPVASRGDIANMSDISVESFELCVEGNFRIPVNIVKPTTPGPFAPLIVCSGEGRQRSMAATGPASAIELARGGRMVVVPDLRFIGDMSLDNLVGVGPTGLMTFVPAYAQDEWLCNQDRSFRYHIRRAWQRNSIIWGRPLVGMMVTDIQSLVDHLHTRPDADLSRLEIIGKTSAEDPDGSVPLAVLFAAALDSRLKQIDIDLGGRSFEERTLPAVPFVLRHGDVLQWASCVADRQLTLRDVSEKAGDVAWLKNVFVHASDAGNLRLVAKP